MTGLFRLAFATTRDGAEAAERALDAASPAPVSIARFAEGGTWWLEALYAEGPNAAAIARALAGALGSAPPFDLAPLPARDWVAGSLEGLAPVRAGRFLVHGRHDRGAAAPPAIAIEIEAGAAFGTGHHPTTRGCLIALDAILKATPRPLTLDLGTGTGVLAIAMAKATKRRVMAADIDPVAARIARANARANAAAPLVDVICSPTPLGPEIARRAPYELVVANILAAPLIAIAAAVRRITVQRSNIVLSGLLVDQAAAVRAAWRAHGFVILRELDIDGWATLVLARGKARGGSLRLEAEPVAAVQVEKSLCPALLRGHDRA